VVAHDACPHPAGGAELGDFLKEIVVRVEEEAEASSELVDVEPGGDGGLDVGHAVGEGEGDLLHCTRARFEFYIVGCRWWDNRSAASRFLIQRANNGICSLLWQFSADGMALPVS